jgi:prepilin-type processing-associated H-X9-DG protein
MYTENNNGYFPLVSDWVSDPDRAWVNTVKPYVENVGKTYICPADPKGRERLAANPLSTSYVFNDYLNQQGGNPAFPRFQHLSATSRTMTVFTGSDRRGTNWSEDHCHARLFFRTPDDGNAWTRILAGIQPDRFGGPRGDFDRDPGHHTSGNANYLFADGHVEAIQAAQIKEWADSNVNFALPPR